MGWDVGLSQDCDAWFRTLDDGDQEAVVDAVEHVKGLATTLTLRHSSAGAPRGRVAGTLRELRITGPDLRSPSGPSRRAQTYRRQQESLAALPAGRGRPLPPLAGPLLDRCCGRGGSPALLPMLKALLLGDGALCRRDHLEPIVGDRLTAFDREPVVSASQAVLGALERG